MGIGCGLTAEFPPYHPLAVVCVGTGAYLLASVAAKAAAKAKKSDSKVDSRTAYGLPIGAWMILGNCAIYSITSRLDKLAVLAAGKTLYYAYGRVIMASTCFLGVRPGKEAVKELTQPKVASLVLATCAAEAVYMLALYQAFACISPVYVTAIKRGGGVLLASHGGVLESRPNSKKRPLFTISRGHDTPRRPATRIKRPRHAKPPQVLRVDVLLQGAAGRARLPDRGDRRGGGRAVPLRSSKESIRFHVVAAAAGGGGVEGFSRWGLVFLMRLRHLLVSYRTLTD